MAAKSTGARILGRTLSLPGALDQKGTRWMLQTLAPGAVLVLVHRGRRSGKVYKTPVEALIEERDTGRIVISPMWGTNSDWYRNVVAGGLREIHLRGETRNVEWRELSETERRTAMDAYHQAHPLYSRVVLRMLKRVNGLDGDAEQAVLDNLPMIELRPTGGA